MTKKGCKCKKTISIGANVSCSRRFVRGKERRKKIILRLESKKVKFYFGSKMSKKTGSVGSEQ